MGSKKYWEEKLKVYASKDWGDKPTIFAAQITGYLPKKGKLLELGAGNGQDSLYFSRQGYEVTSTDLIGTALVTAKRKAGEEGLGINFQEIDTSKPLPFNDESFDIVYSHLALHYLDKAGTEKLFLEIYRVLKAGGIMASIFNTAEDPEPHCAEFEKVEENYYRKISANFCKRYFSIEETECFINGLFEPLLLDNKGQSYNKSQVNNLIRLVGKKKG